MCSTLSVHEGVRFREKSSEKGMCLKVGGKWMACSSKPWELDKQQGNRYTSI
jgi:hypothetical protein